MGVYTTAKADILTLHATLLSRDGTVAIQESLSGPRSDAERIGQALAHQFLSNADAIPLLGDLGQKRPLTYGAA